MADLPYTLPGPGGVGLPDSVGDPSAAYSPADQTQVLPQSLPSAGAAQPLLPQAIPDGPQRLPELAEQPSRFATQQQAQRASERPGFPERLPLPDSLPVRFPEQISVPPPLPPSLPPPAAMPRFPQEFPGQGSGLPEAAPNPFPAPQVVQQQDAGQRFPDGSPLPPAAQAAFQQAAALPAQLPGGDPSRFGDTPVAGGSAAQSLNLGAPMRELLAAIQSLASATRGTPAPTAPAMLPPLAGGIFAQPGGEAYPAASPSVNVSTFGGNYGAGGWGFGSRTGGNPADFLEPGRRRPS